MSFTAYAAKRVGKRRWDVCNGRFGLVRHRFGRMQFCCKVCFDSYVSSVTHEAHRSEEFLAERIKTIAS
jgi:hypothetical protein